jgi:hypothetical protein
MSNARPRDDTMLDSAIRFLQWQGVLLVGPAMSLIYFAASPNSQRVYARLFASSHGVVIALLYLAAGLVHEWKLSKPSYAAPFTVTLLLPLGLMLLSLFVYRGPKYVHGLQVVNLLCLFWTSFVGGMAVTGDWL